MLDERESRFIAQQWPAHVIGSFLITSRMAGEINYVSHLPRLSPVDSQSYSVSPTNAFDRSLPGIRQAKNPVARVRTVVSYISSLLFENSITSLSLTSQAVSRIIKRYPASSKIRSIIFQDLREY